MRLLRDLTLLLALLAWLAPAADAEASRKRLRRMRGKPMPKAALDPKGTAARILKEDPNFAKLVKSQNAEWKKGLSTAVENWGKQLRKRPVRLLRPRPKMPDVKLPDPKWGMPKWKWPSISWPSVSLPSWPRIPWVKRPSIGVPEWVGLPSWIAWPSWMSWPRIPWVRSIFRWPEFRAVGATDWILSWIHGVAMIALAGFASFVGVLLLLLVLTRLGNIRVAGYWLAGLLRLLPGRIRTWIERLAGLVAPREAIAPTRVAQAEAAAPEPSQERVELEQRTPLSWKHFAHELMAQGNGQEALRALYLAMMARLDREGLIRFDHTLTNWDYRMMLPRGQIRTAFSELCRLFDQTVYGEYPCDQQTFARGDELVEQILDLTGAGTPPPVMPT